MSIRPPPCTCRQLQSGKRGEPGTARGKNVAEEMLEHALERRDKEHTSYLKNDGKVEIKKIAAVFAASSSGTDAGRRSTRQRARPHPRSSGNSLERPPLMRPPPTGTIHPLGMSSRSFQEQRNQNRIGMTFFNLITSNFIASINNRRSPQFARYSLNPQKSAMVMR